MEKINAEVEIVSATLDAIKFNGNIRTSANAISEKELADNISKVGLLNPLLVQRVDKDDGGFKLIAGHRRFRAVKSLGWKTVPVRVVEATHEAALEMQIAENLQRQDLTPLEEARAFESLLKLHRDWLAADVAKRTDKSVAYVMRALSLLTLKPKTLELIANGAIEAEVGHQIARVEGKQRDTVESFATTKGSWTKEYPSLDDVKTQIERTVAKDLTKAVFPKDVANYGGTTTPACAACPSNTGNQDVLFDGAEKGSCTNPGCFAKRTAAWYKEFQQKAATKLEGLKFVGAVSHPGYGTLETVKGFPLIDAKKNKERMEKNPEKFGFAVVRPSRFDTKTKPEVVVVSLNKAEKPKAAPQHDYKKDQFVSENVKSALNMAAWKKCRALKPFELEALFRDLVSEQVLTTVMLFEGGKNIDKFIKQLEPTDMLWLLFMSTIPGWEANAKNWDRFGIEAQKIAEAAKKEAEEKYSKQK